MKKLFITTVIMSSFAIITAFASSNTIPTKTEVSFTSDYCDGWEDGYCEGWKDVKGTLALCPLTPLCPLPELGKSGYRDGYNRGFKAGSRAAQR